VLRRCESFARAPHGSMQRGGTKRFAAEAPADHASYLAFKEKKLKAQDEELGAQLRAERADDAAAGGGAAAASDTLFAGVRLWVNGLTEPPAETLKEIVVQHGGQHFNTHHHTVTHIVAANVSTAREADLRRSRTAKVVTAAWVVESQRQGRLLKEGLFSALPAEPAQRSVAALLPGSSPGALAAASTEQQRGARPGPAASPEQLARANAPQKASRSAVSTADVSAQEFLTSYRANSRLHFIGTWRQRINFLVYGPRPSCNPSLEMIILHIDMDCYFVSVLLRDRVDLRGLPVAVSHGSATSDSSGEVSSASYEALAMGVRKGQRVGDAMTVCPNLVVLQYDFEKFEEVSLQVFRVLASVSAAMQPMSVDEAYLDVTGLTDDPLELAATIRERIRQETGGCVASIGIGPNKLVAKMATRRAKPDGIFRVTSADVPGFMGPQPVLSLFGVGYGNAEKLRAMGIETAAQLATYDLAALKRVFGPIMGSRLQTIAKGESDSPVQPPEEHQQSISVNCNWGVRFREQDEADAFLSELARELAQRLEEDGRAGRRLTLKAMRSQDINAEPAKFLGHGFCETFSKSVVFKCATAHAGALAAEAKLLLTALSIEPDWIRGLALTMSDLVQPTAGSHVHHGAQPSMAAVLAAPGRRPEAAPLLSTREYAGLSMSQLPQETIAALGTQMVAELSSGLRSSRARGGAAGRVPAAKPSHPVDRQHKAGAKQTRRQASKPAKRSTAQPLAALPAAPAPPPPPAPLCEPCPVPHVLAELKKCVLAAPTDGLDDRLDAAGRLLQAFCSSCVAQNDMLSVQRLLRFARSLVADAPAWGSHCEAAVDASQRCVWERFHTSIHLADPGC